MHDYHKYHPIQIDNTASGMLSKSSIGSCFTQWMQAVFQPHAAKMTTSLPRILKPTMELVYVQQFGWNLWGRCESTVLFKLKRTNLKILFCSVLKYNRSGISTWCPHDTTTWVGTSTAQIKSFHRSPISRPTGHKIISLGPTVHCFWCLNLIMI